MYVQCLLKACIHCKSFCNSNTKQLGDLFQKQKIKGSLWNLCAAFIQSNSLNQSLVNRYIRK